MRTMVFCAIWVSLGLAGCNEDSKPGSATRAGAPEGLNEPLAEVPAAQVTSGFKHGRLRENFDVFEFSISKQPITLAQYRTCVTAGACSEPTLSCANGEGDEDDAALCVGHENARAYCAWSGGRLPSLSEWLLAARGRTPQRFSWGDAAPTCEQHPLAQVPLEEQASEPEPDETECHVRRSQQYRVGRHDAGASTYGLEDVLIAPAELLAGNSETNFGACRSTEHGCLVYGMTPGAIDSVKPVADAADAPVTSGTQRVEQYPHAFRCVWSKEGT